MVQSGSNPVRYSSLIGTLIMSLTVVSASLTSLAQVAPPANRDGRTEPFTVNYGKGRTYRTAYEKDPNSSNQLMSDQDLNRVCFKSQKFDFDAGSLGQVLSQRYFKNTQLNDFDIVVYVSIPLQKMFVLDRSVYENSSRGDGLKYAWKTSTGYHDKHWSYSKKAGGYVFGQKGSVQITHRNKEDALQHLKNIGKKKGAQYIASPTTPKVVFPGSEKKVIYSERVSKMRKDRAIESGLPLLGEDPNLPGFFLVKKYSLNYEEYYHTQPGYYVVQNGFSSRHISGESDGSYEVEQPTMPWALFFNIERGAATHGAAYRGSMGSPNSHGCIRLLEENACRLFHLVGQKGKGNVSMVNEKTGAVSNKKMDAYKTLFVVTDEVSDTELRNLGIK